MSGTAVVVKLSGAAFANTRPFDGCVFEDLAMQIAAIYRRGMRIGIVTGGGNIYRGTQPWGMRGMPQQRRDELGMGATALNALALLYQLQSYPEIPVRILTKANGIAAAGGSAWDEYDFERHSEVVIVAGGTGKPGVSSDVAAPMLARDMRASHIIMSKHGVDGVYTSDPHAPQPGDPPAEFLPQLTIDQALEWRLRVMDRDAMLMCRDWGIAVSIVGSGVPQSVLRRAGGEALGSLVVPSSGASNAPDSSQALADISSTI